MTTTPDTSPAPAQSARRSNAALWLILLLLLAAAGAWGWKQWQARGQHERAATELEVQMSAIDSRIDALRRDQRAQGQRLQQADATNRVMRDELLGIGQRAALIEDTVGKLSDPDRHGAQALRLDETELLLVMGQQRLAIAGDLEGARRAYVLAGRVLDGIDDPAYLSLRQTLQQERASLDALGIDPRVQAMAELDAFAQTAMAMPMQPTEAIDTQTPWWRRAFSGLVDVRPSDRAVAVQPADRVAAIAGLQLEISLARAAAERRDTTGFRGALQRADGWLTRLWPESPALQRERARLKFIAARPLSPVIPTLGSTLQQLRQLRGAK